MSDTKYDVLTIGNAIVDIIAKTDDAFLVEQDITKGGMTLIDMNRAEQLYSDMGPAIETSGGSAGNTAAGIATIGVDFETPPLDYGETTARSMILVTPDGERSMNTYLGACTKLSAKDIDHEVVAQSKITYFEGYLWDPADAKDAIREAARIAHENDRLVAMTLSDDFCVDRYRDEFLELIRSGAVDICFANESEIKSLYQTSDLNTAVAAIREDCNLSIVTMSENGSMVITREKTGTVDAQPIDELVDTTGAGDLYAAGFLYGLTNGRELGECATLGSIAAAEVIQHIGPRPQASLKELAEQLGL
ncbi:putative sugar kinase [Nymphon striatum]|nr:putative sugar kinase [Nymphon striatum]